MRIAIDARYLSAQFSGIGAYSENLLVELSALDSVNEYHVLIHQSLDRDLRLGDNFHLIRCDSRPLSLTTVFRLHREIESLDCDFLHAHFPVTPIYYTGKMITTVHDLQPLLMAEWTGGRAWPIKKAYDYFYHWMYPRTFRESSFLIADSQSTAQSLEQWVPDKQRIATILLGAPPDAGQAVSPAMLPVIQEKYGVAKRYLFYIGSTRANKNLPRMLEAFALLRRRNPEFKDLQFVMVLAADRNVPDVMRCIEAWGLSMNVKILPPVQPEEKRALMFYAQLLFFATMFEGFGFPVLEAQAQSTPVLASSHSSLPQVAGEDAALLCDAFDVEEMSQAVERLLTDEELRDRLVANGLKNLGRFSWKDCAQKTLDVYRRMVAE